MQRRDILKGAIAAPIAGAALAAPAVVRAQPRVRWRMPSSFPQVLDAVYGAGSRSPNGSPPSRTATS